MAPNPDMNAPGYPGVPAYDGQQTGIAPAVMNALNNQPAPGAHISAMLAGLGFDPATISEAEQHRLRLIQSGSFMPPLQGAA